MRDIYQEYMDTCHDFYDIYPEERMRDVSRYVFCTSPVGDVLFNINPTYIFVFVDPPTAPRSDHPLLKP